MHKGNITLPRVMRWLATLAVVIVVVDGMAGIWAPEIDDGVDVIPGFRLMLEITNQYAGYEWYLRLIVIGVPSALLAYAMLQLARMLAYAARGEVFSAPASRHFRSFGVWLLAATLSDVLLPAPVHLTHFLLAPTDTFSLGIRLDSEVLWKLFLSTLLMLLARVLSDAYQLAEENRQFI